MRRPECTTDDKKYYSVWDGGGRKKHFTLHLNVWNWWCTPSCFVHLYIYFLHMYAVGGCLGRGDSCTNSIQCISLSRSHKDTHAHTGCQSCSFSASHIILYKSYINASTAFFFFFGMNHSATPLRRVITPVKHIYIHLLTSNTISCIRTRGGARPNVKWHLEVRWQGCTPAHKAEMQA